MKSLFVIFFIVKFIITKKSSLHLLYVLLKPSDKSASLAAKLRDVNLLELLHSADINKCSGSATTKKSDLLAKWKTDGVMGYATSREVCDFSPGYAGYAGKNQLYHI